MFRKDAFAPALLAKRGLSARQAAAILALRDMGEITTGAYMRIADVSEATALRDLRELTRRGILERRGAGVLRTTFCYVCRTDHDLRESVRMSSSPPAEWRRGSVRCPGPVIHPVKPVRNPS